MEKWSGVDLRTAMNKTCKEIELQIHNLLTILDAIVNIIGGPYVIILWLGKSSLRTMKRIFIQALKIMRNVATCTNWIRYSSHTNYVLLNLQEVGAVRVRVRVTPAYIRG